MKNKHTALFIGGSVVVVLALFIYPKIKGNSSSYSGDLPCLAPNLPLALHWHPHLVITVDGTNELIPANLGLSGSCHRPLHTHETDGVIHLETQVARDYKFSEFLEIGGQPIQREGYTLAMTVDGKPNSELGNLLLKDKQEIVLKYTKIATGN